MSPSQHDTSPVSPTDPAEQETLGRPDAPATVRFRYTPTAFIPLAIAAICAVPVAIALGTWGLLLAVPFILGAITLRRVGLDVERDEVRVRGALSTVTIPRSDLVGFVVDKKHVRLVRNDTSTVRIPTVRPRDLPTLREALFPPREPASETS